MERWTGKARFRDRERGPFPGQCDRHESIHPSPDRSHDEGESKDRIGGDGFCRSPHPPGNPYDSLEALKLGEEIMAFIKSEEKRVKRIGVEARSFANFDGSVLNGDGTR